MLFRSQGGIRQALTTALAPFGEHLEVEPYPVHEAGAPADSAWAANLRGKGLLRAGTDPTWPEIAAVHNRHFRQEPGDDNHLYTDGEGRGYFLSTRNPLAKWDGYVIGGQWSGHFVPRPDADGDPRLINAEPRPADGSGQDGTPRCDGGPRALLDLDALRDLRAREAAGRHAPGTASSRARAASRARARDEAVPGDALLRLDGTWTEPGDGTEDSRAAYLRAANEYLDHLDGDAILVVVHCHC